MTPSHLLKVTNFLVKISLLIFLVMTEKNIFACKLFLSLNISDFSTPLFSRNLPLKIEILSTPPPSPPPPCPLFENLVGVSNPPAEKEDHLFQLSHLPRHQEHKNIDFLPPQFCWVIPTSDHLTKCFIV